ncbi:hypothetical protein ACFQAS_05515 [Halopenitus salinus]|uniref:DUF7122 domain-containing protein n=1 Tax=Halopenitus salinus TaxID=1198295 RepID=A0ABD5V1Z2_9EURY
MSQDGGDGAGGDASDAPPTNDGQRFDRLPATDDDRDVPGRPTREEVLEWWETRFGVDPAVFEPYDFYEKGAGKIWVYAGEATNPARIEALGMTLLRTRQEHWKPTTRTASRFGRHASRNVIDLEPEEATSFLAGEDQPVERWDGDWGYLIATHEIAGDAEPIGVGLYLHGELRSRVPKGSRRDLA